MDLISRQTIFDMLDEVLEDVEDGEGFQYEKWMERAEDLPTAHDCADCPAYKTFFEDVAGQTDVEILGIIRSMYNCFDENERRVYLALSHAIDVLEKMPTVEPKTGKWIWLQDDEGFSIGCECSECKESYVMPDGWANYCPNCGAKMEGVEVCD